MNKKICMQFIDTRRTTYYSIYQQSFLSTNELKAANLYRPRDKRDRILSSNELNVYISRGKKDRTLTSDEIITIFDRATKSNSNTCTYQYLYRYLMDIPIKDAIKSKQTPRTIRPQLIIYYELFDLK